MEKKVDYNSYCKGCKYWKSDEIEKDLVCEFCIISCEPEWDKFKGCFVCGEYVEILG